MLNRAIENNFKEETTYLNLKSINSNDSRDTVLFTVLASDVYNYLVLNDTKKVGLIISNG